MGTSPNQVDIPDEEVQVGIPDEEVELSPKNTGGVTGTWRSPTPQDRAQRRNLQAQPGISPSMRKEAPAGKRVVTGLEAMEAVAPFAIPGAEVAEAGSLRPLIPFARGVAKSAVGALAGKYGGGKVGGLFGETGRELGELAGEFTGALTGPFASDEAIADIPWIGKHLYSEDEIAAMKAARLAKQYAAEVKAGVRKPIPPPPDPEYVKQKTITEAQEQAQKENVKRGSAAAKAREAGFNKEAQDRMAIQKRADDAEAARVKAEKDAKNARFKADQEHERELAAAEKARQDEITAQAKLRDVQEQMKAADEAKEQGRLKLLQQQEKQAIKEANDAAAQKERLRNQHADALMRRGREQAALDKAAEDANAEEDSAKAEVSKKTPQGDGGGRPTASERFLTGLLKRNVLTPEEDAQGSRLFGDKWKLRPGEGPAGRTNRLMGDIHAMRPAKEMADVSTGPVAQAKIPPPPSPPSSSPKVSFTTDTMGVRWAHSPESPNPVSIPKSVPEGEVEEYATRKLREQAEMAQKVKSRVPGGSGESGASAEAINRTAAEKRAGVKYFIEDTRTKSRTPVSSTDVNAGLRVGPGKRIIRSSPEGDFEF